MELAEIKFIEKIIDTLEDKNETIIELKVQQALHDKQVKDIQDNWKKQFIDSDNELQFLIEDLKKNGFITTEMREKYNIPK